MVGGTARLPKLERQSSAFRCPNPKCMSELQAPLIHGEELTPVNATVRGGLCDAEAQLKCRWRPK